jgi:hypothetical protein
MSEWSGEVVNESHNLSNAQVCRLLKMTECLRNPVNAAQVAMIKSALSEDQVEDALAYWSEFRDHEQVALWIAPTYGGIFTTEERKQLRPTTTEAE